MRRFLKHVLDAVSKPFVTSVCSFCKVASGGKAAAQRRRLLRAFKLPLKAAYDQPQVVMKGHRKSLVKNAPPEREEQAKKLWLHCDKLLTHYSMEFHYHGGPCAWNCVCTLELTGSSVISTGAGKELAAMPDFLARLPPVTIEAVRAFVDSKRSERLGNSLDATAVRYSLLFHNCKTYCYKFCLFAQDSDMPGWSGLALEPSSGMRQFSQRIEDAWFTGISTNGD